MATLVLSDPTFEEHDPGEGHPESPARLRSILDVLGNAPLSHVEMRLPRPATEAELSQVHDAALIQRLRDLSGSCARLDPDTAMSAKSYQAAILAAGAGVQAVEAVMQGTHASAFALVRPPGHHA